MKDLPKLEISDEFAKNSEVVSDYIETYMPDIAGKSETVGLVDDAIRMLREIENIWNSDNPNIKLLEEVGKTDTILKTFLWDVENFINNQNKFEIIEQIISEIKADPFLFIDAVSKGGGLDTFMRAKAIKHIRLTGTDFISSKFDVNILVTSKEGSDDFFRKFISEMDLDIDLNSFGFLSRVEGITIPQLKAKSFSIRTANDLVSKVSSSIEGNNKSSLKIRADEMCYIYDMMNLVSNNNELSSKGDRNIKKLSTFSTLRMADNLKHRTTIDIVVRNSCLETNPYHQFYEGALTNYYADQDLKRDDRCLWVFHDVNFLGFNSGPSFSHNSSDKQTLEINFIFKRLVRIDPKKVYKSPNEKIDMFFDRFNKLEEKEFYYDIPKEPEKTEETVKEAAQESMFNIINPAIPIHLDLELSNSGDEGEIDLIGTNTDLGKGMDPLKVYKSAEEIEKTNEAFNNLNNNLKLESEKIKNQRR